MRKFKFINEQFYHVYNRGVDKRTVFLDQRDHERFVYLLYACNDKRPLLNSQFYYRGFASIVRYPRGNEQLVDILCVCLMPNHYHLILRQRSEGGISKFMQKLGTAYTMYFNTKYKRSGILFQGVFKSVHIDKEGYLVHLTRYIHLNPVELKEPARKEKGIKNFKQAHAFAKSYKWSSYQDYLNRPHLKPILATELIKEFVLVPARYESFVGGWLSENKRIIADYLLED